MTDAAQIKVLHDGPRNAIVQLSSVSDGSGETGATKITPGDLHGGPIGVAVDKIQYTTSGMAVSLLWDAGTDQLLWSVPADDEGCIDFRRMGGLHNPKAADSTGLIKLTTAGHSNGDTYNIILHMHKKWELDALSFVSSAAVSVQENDQLALVLSATLASTFTIIGGVDAAQFVITSGVLTWVADGAQDFETPADDDEDNDYVVVVRATDAYGRTADQTITVTVTNEEE